MQVPRRRGDRRNRNLPRAAQGDIRATSFPSCAAAALRNKGVQPLLDAVVRYLPSPVDVPPVEAINPDTGETIAPRPTRSAVFGVVFKIMTDPFIGRLAFVRVYSGKLSPVARSTTPTADA